MVQLPSLEPGTFGWGRQLDPYTTMTFAAKAQIARELMKFLRSRRSYRGSKPVTWSVVEKDGAHHGRGRTRPNQRHDLREVSCGQGGPQNLPAARSSSGRRYPGRSPGNRHQLFAEYGLWLL